ncbi:MAG: hypothetical protein AAB930_02485 [Patescibacteria group bacterium]
MPGLNPEMRSDKKVLMCISPPKINWEDPTKNPHMQMANQPDAGRALSQLGKLLHHYDYFGVEVDYLDPNRSLGDQVFTANLAYGLEGTFVMANMSVNHRKPEVPIASRWLVEHRYNVCFLPEFDKSGNPIYYEGQANFVTTATEHFYGYGIRNSLEAVEETKKILRLKKPIKPLELVSPEFYDHDLSLRYFPHRDSIMFCPDAFAGWSVDVIRKSRPANRLYEVPHDMAIQNLGTFGKNFFLNGVYFNDVVTFPWNEDAEEFPPNIRRWLGDDCEIVLIDFSEFGKSGGGHKCVSLFLN